MEGEKYLPRNSHYSLYTASHHNWCHILFPHHSRQTYTVPHMHTFTLDNSTPTLQPRKSSIKRQFFYTCLALRTSLATSIGYLAHQTLIDRSRSIVWIILTINYCPTRDTHYRTQCTIKSPPTPLEQCTCIHTLNSTIKQCWNEAYVTRCTRLISHHIQVCECTVYVCIDW